MKLRSLAPLALLLLCPLVATAQEASDLPSYQPGRPVSGTIRSWGHGYLKKMMGLWEEGFKVYHPDVRFEDTLVSSASAMAGLYTGRADIGVLAREITPPEVAAYEKISRQKLTPVTVLTGSFGNQDKMMALGVFVNRANPLAQLSFAQLDAIFGAEHKRGAKANLRTWGQVGVTGSLATQRIQPYSGLAFEAPAYFFSQTVMNGSVLWNPHLRQFDNVEDEKQRYVDAYQKVVDAVGSESNAIGIAGAGYHNPGAKLVALAQDESGPFVPATPENVAALRYPLARPIRFYINNGPAVPPDPRVIEFMRFILSREGQKLVAQEGDFFPLTAQTVVAERAKLPPP